MIPVVCAACGGSGKAPPHWAGRTVPCPRCKASIIVPAPAAEREAPQARKDDEEPLRLREDRPAPGPATWQPKRKAAAGPPKPKKKSKRRTGDVGPERRWWLFGLVLVPLFALLFSEDHAVVPAVDGADEDVLAVVASLQSDHPLLPADTWLHWPLAIACGGALAAFAVAVFPRGDTPVPKILGMAVGAAVVGVLAVFAINLFRLPAFRVPIVIFPVWIFATVVRFGNMVANAPGAGLGAKCFGETLATGLPEELAKLALLLFLAHRAGKADWRGMRILGVASGIGFGSAEAILYASTYLNGHAGWDHFSTRFISCAGMHGIFSGVAALMVYRGAERLETDGFGSALVQLCKIVAAAAILHGCYDGCLEADHPLLALVPVAAAFALLGWLSIDMQRKEG